MSKISVIVPVYKAEKFLRKCIDSIINQTFHDWELLLVDDGSPDNCGRICDDYSKIDSRIRVFHVQNGGVSKARNYALNKSKGDWIMFVDADDVIHPDTILLCLEIAESEIIDIIQTSVCRTIEDLGGNNGLSSDALSPNSYLVQRKYRTTVCGGVIRKSIFTNNSICFDEDLKLAEDQKCIFSCIACARRIKRINNQLYFYRPNELGATYSQQTSDLINSIISLRELKQKYPILKDAIDISQISMIKHVIKNADLPYNNILTLYKQSDIERRWRRIPKDACTLQKISSFSITGAIIYQQIINILQLFKTIIK